MSRKPTCLCGTCAKCKHRVYMHSWYQNKTPEERREWVAKRDRDKVRTSDRRRYERDKPKRIALSTAYRAQDDPIKVSARIAVNNAVRDGRLTKGECEFAGIDCDGRIEAHHIDYTKPLKVTWLCAKHHGETHRKF